MKKITIPIKGMHCKACVLNVEEALNNIKGIKKVDVDLKNNQAVITYQKDKPDETKIREKLREFGYDLGEEKKPVFTDDITVYRDVLVGVLVVMIAYFVLRISGYTEFVYGFDLMGITSIGGWFLIGLVAGVSTCMAIIGGILASMSAHWKDKYSSSENIKLQGVFHISRLLSFFVLGGILGVIGNLIGISSFAYGIMFVVVGLVMLQLGINILGISPKLASFSPSLPSGVFGSLKQKLENLSSGFYSAGIGAVTFFLPCGFTLAAQLFAVSTGSFFVGGGVMLAFALGNTIPLMGIGVVTAFLKGVVGKLVFRVLALIIIVVGGYNLVNGYSLLQESFQSTNEEGQEEQEIQTHDEEQIGEDTTSNGEDKDSDLEVVELEISGMFCAVNCPRIISNALTGMYGVESADVDALKNIATVEYDEQKVSPEDMVENDVFTEGPYGAEIK